MSTLPRTRSLSGADTSSLSRNYRHERNRPASLCESSWNKVDSSAGPLQDKLRRTPSQANNLCTTVPTCIVNKTLGGRHTPTRNSLRHSRMAVIARNAKGAPRRWTRNRGFGRVASLVICAFILVGAMGVLLSLWLLQWLPSLPFKELSHYPGAAIISSGIFALVLIYCLPRHRKSLAQALKILLMVMLLGSLLSCACVCVFDTLHLISLAPMECQIKNDVIIHPASPASGDAPQPPAVGEAPKPLIKTLERIKKHDDSEEGSGSSFRNQFVDDEEDFPVEEALEVESTSLSAFPARINSAIYVNVSTCACSTRKDGWRIVVEYPKLNCDEVKNILPIFLVASCVLMVVGGVLSAVLMFLMWPTKKESYGLVNPSETKPFIFKSNFKSYSNHPLNNVMPTNGNHLYR